MHGPCLPVCCARAGNAARISREVRNSLIIDLYSHCRLERLQRATDPYRPTAMNMAIRPVPSAAIRRAELAAGQMHRSRRKERQRLRSIVEVPALRHMGKGTSRPLDPIERYDNYRPGEGVRFSDAAPRPAKLLWL